ncbi:MAG TPA: hypothetical protein VLV78_01795 [Thermoanaerobaculia bacterium]|nr:hypothetical protein [Thermoanaerobaculia bacterium]
MIINAARWAFSLALAIQAALSLHHQGGAAQTVICVAEIVSAVLFAIPATVKIAGIALVAIFVFAGIAHGGFTAMWLIYPTLLVLLILGLSASNRAHD